MTETFDVIYGNDALKSWLLTQISHKSLGHAYIIEGQSGSGKRTFAKYAAAAIACTEEHPPCMSCAACKKILKGISPDVILFEQPDSRKTIGVDFVRALREQVYIIPSELDCKIYIVCNADTMTVQAQNAFLKILEEPPKNVYFLLLCSNASAFLPTIRSRAPVRKMQIFTDEELSLYLENNFEAAKKLIRRSPEEYSDVIRASHGTIGQALTMMSSKDAEKIRKNHSRIDRILSALIKSDHSEFLTEIKSFPSKRDEIIDTLESIYCALRDIAAVKSCESPELIFYRSVSEARELAEKLPMSAVIKFSDATLKVADDIKTNLNTSSTLLYYSELMWKYK